MTKAVIIKDERGDFNWNRLFFHLIKNGIEIKKINFLKQNVIFLETSQGRKILKGYKSKKNIITQYRFILSLHSNGFVNTPSMELLLDGNQHVLHVNHYYWAMYPFVDKSKEFTFHSTDDRKRGLQVILTFHNITQNLVPLFESHLPYYSLHKKWAERMNIFIKSSSLFKYYFGEKNFQYIYSISQYSCSYLNLYDDDVENKKNVIIHGDVAHHNFIRRNRHVYLIDFDLISIGSKSIDILQYTNRILPFLGWSMNELLKIDELIPFLNKKWFLSCLLYPQDVFREWMRYMIVLQQQEQDNKDKFILDIKSNIEKRKQFVVEIFNMIR